MKYMNKILILGQSSFLGSEFDNFIKNREIDILNSYLPQMISEDNIRNIVQTVVDEVGAVSMADLGKVMPKVMERGEGLIDGKTAQQFVREILG